MCSPTDIPLAIGAKVHDYRTPNIPNTIRAPLTVRRVHLDHRTSGHSFFYILSNYDAVWGCKVKRLNADSSHELW